MKGLSHLIIDEKHNILKTEGNQLNQVTSLRRI